MHPGPAPQVMWEQLQEESTSLELEEPTHWSEIYTLPVVTLLQTVACGGLQLLKQQPCGRLSDPETAALCSGSQRPLSRLQQRGSRT